MLKTESASLLNIFEGSDDRVAFNPLGDSTIPFEEKYILGSKINSGAFGVVFETHHISSTKKRFAVKVLQASHEDDWEKLLYEVYILHCLKNVPNVIQMVDFFVEGKSLHIVQTLAGGGDVLDRILEKDSYSEKDALKLGKTLISIVGSLHQKNIVHRDIKPENLLLKSKHDDTEIYLCDFGEAKVVPDGDVLSTFCGTPEYIAPEILLGYEYREEVDMWSVGCILFLVLSGYLPFGDQEDERELFERACEADYDFDEACWDDITPEAKRLIFNLLKVDPEDRWTASQALACSWFTKSQATKKQVEPTCSKGMNLAILKYIKNKKKDDPDFDLSDFEINDITLHRNIDAWKNSDVFSKPFCNKFTKKRLMEEDNKKKGKGKTLNAKLSSQQTTSFKNVGLQRRSFSAVTA